MTMPATTMSPPTTCNASSDSPMSSHAAIAAITGSAVDVSPTRAAGMSRTAPTLNRYGTTVATTTTPATYQPISPARLDHGSVHGGRAIDHASTAVPNP